MKTRACLGVLAGLALALCGYATAAQGDDRPFWTYDGPQCHSDDDEGYCDEYPLELRAAGAASIPLYERPDEASPVVARIAPGEAVKMIGFRQFNYHAHRGRVVKAGAGLSAGDTVYPLWGEADAYPFHDWDDPTDAAYEVTREQTDSTLVFFNAPDAPQIRWERLAVKPSSASWKQIKRADGTVGWTPSRPCAFEPEEDASCEDGAPRDQHQSPPPKPLHPRLLHTLRADVIVDAAFTSDGRQIVTLGHVLHPTGDKGEWIMRRWDAATYRPIDAFPKPGGVAATQDGARVAVIDGDGVSVWTWSGRRLAAMEGESGSPTHAAFSPDGGRLITWGAEGRARVWDAATGRQLLALEGHTSAVIGAAFSSDGTRIVTSGGGFGDNTIRVWKADDGRLVHTLTPSSGGLPGAAAFSPDGTRLAGVAWDKVVVFDATTGREQFSFGRESRHDPVHSIIYSNDGSRILASGPFGEVSVWNAANGALVRELSPFDPAIPGVRPGPRAPVDAAYFSPDAARIITVGRGVAQIWQAEPGR